MELERIKGQKKISAQQSFAADAGAMFHSECLVLEIIVYWF